jgi:YbbR domain-containing protein
MIVTGGFLRGFFSDMPTKIICLTAAVLLFFFHRINTLEKKSYEAHLQSEIPAGLAISSAFENTVQITLRGTKEAVDQIQEEDIEAGVDLSGIKIPGDYRVAVRITRKGKSQNIEPLEVTVEPQEIAFKLEPLMERRVKLIADLRGSPAYGYDLADYTLTPQTVVIRGAKSLVQAANALSTEVIDLTGRTGPFVLKSAVVLPNPLIRIVGEPMINFEADIKETVQAKRFEPVEMSSSNLSAAFEIKSLPSGRIQVQGPQLVVEALKSEQLRLVADCSSIHRPGTYTIRLKPETPSNVIVLDFEPKEIAVEAASSSD